MLSRCIGIEPATFATDYWGRKPLLSPAGTLPRDFSDLLSPDMVDELIAERGVRGPFIRLAKEGRLLPKDSYLGPAGFGAEIADQVDSAKVLAEVGSGATVVLQGLHRLWPPLIDFVRRAVEEIGHAVQANAYITPPGNRGFDFHYDIHDVFVLQVSGTKRWIIHEPVHRHPLPTQPWTDHRDRIEQRAAGDPVIDVQLEAGDALYLPRGWVHAAQALDTTSIHLTIGVAATTLLDVARAVLDHLSLDEDFRAPLPLGIDPCDRDAMTAATAKVVSHVVTYLRDNPETVATAAAEQLISRHGARTRAEAVRPLATLRAVEDSGHARVRCRQGLNATLRPKTEDGIVLALPDKVITFPALCAAAVEALLSGRVADASTLPGLDAADGAVLIRRLLREGVVVPTDAQPSGSKLTW